MLSKRTVDNGCTTNYGGYIEDDKNEGKRQKTEGEYILTIVVKGRNMCASTNKTDSQLKRDSQRSNQGTRSYQLKLPTTEKTEIM